MLRLVAICLLLTGCGEAQLHPVKAESQAEIQARRNGGWVEVAALTPSYWARPAVFIYYKNGVCLAVNEVDTEVLPVAACEVVGER
jgi:hypothetical protein